MRRTESAAYCARKFRCLCTPRTDSASSCARKSRRLCTARIDSAACRARTLPCPRSVLSACYAREQTCSEACFDFACVCPCFDAITRCTRGV